MEQGISTTRLERSGDERFQRLRTDLGVESFGLNLMRLAPGQRGRVHAHAEQEEVYIVLEGTLTLELGPDEARELGPDEAARVAPDVRRRVANLHPEPLVMIALGGAGQHQSRDGRAWADWDEGGEGRPSLEVPLPDDVPVEGA